MTAPKAFKKVLIANRGEIALRVARTLREMGIAPVAIFSEADRAAPHVRACDYAYCVGPAAARESYLRGEVILDVARRAGVDAIHPGYGFLSENATFAEQVAKAGLVFIGPPPNAMRVMGSKTGAREAMVRAGVPTVPGSDGPLPKGVEGEEAARRLADTMGYPVMLKASAGGGGKGMRLVHRAEDVASSLRAAASEAQNAFGDDTVYMEKGIINPRHVEIQVFGNADGQQFFIGERECSMQRRHQKVIEETPSPVLDAAMRQRMGEVACKAAAAVNYRGAGTVEFLVDTDKNFYFLEMNTRLQVEHPVTELCYGVDLVEAQVRVAEGHVLPWKQEQFTPRGHAMEARLYAEDPTRNFLPCPGDISELGLPHGPGVRVDCGVTAGFAVPRFYDPMIAKITVWAEDRERARRRMERALSETYVKGIITNAPFLTQLLRCPAYSSGNYHTGTVAEVLKEELPAASPELLDVATVAAVIHTFRRDTRGVRQIGPQRPAAGLQTGWRAAGWRTRGG